jgi:ABC-type multidrug transport system fused ATPase/permease subunit
MRDTFRKLMDLLDARERRNFWLLMGLVLIMGLANMVGIASLLPFLSVLADPGAVEKNPWLAAAYDRSGMEKPLDFLLLLGVVVVALYVGGLAVKAGVTWLLIRFGAMRHYSISRRLLGRYLAQPYAWFLGRHSADLTKSVLGEVSQVVANVLIPMLNLAVNLFLVLVLLALLIAVNPLIAAFVMTLVGGAYIGLYWAIRPRLARMGQERLDANQARFRIVQEGMTGIKEVKVLGLERSLLRRFAEPAHSMAAVQAVSGMLRDLPRNALEALAFGGMMVVVLVLASLNQGDLAAILPVAGVYAVAGVRIIPAMQTVYSNLNQLRFGQPALDALHADFMASPDTLPPPPAEPLRLRERLALEDVDFAYPEAERGALNGISMEIPAGASVGVVGGTGAGKTTAIDVIMGLLEPQAGRLMVDGREIAGDEARRAWRSSIGYVPQQIFLVDASVSENIAFGVAPERIDPEAVERAARMAQLHDFVVSELSEGYATRVGDRGVRLSGGQRQRIGLARALYHDPDMLVLDEATSALDNLTERGVIEAVQELGGRKTVIMIAHRLTTVMGCDEIFLLEHGRVSARGSYQELLERSPAFREMAAGTERMREGVRG